MIERVYQGIIGGLIVVVGVTFYNVYETDTKVQEHASVDISQEKPKYKAIDINKLYASQRADTRAKNIKLDTTLQDYRKSIQKTKEMLSEYSYDEVVQRDTYTYEPNQTNISLKQIQTRVKELNSKLNDSKITTDNSTPPLHSNINSSTTTGGTNQTTTNTINSSNTLIASGTTNTSSSPTNTNNTSLSSLTPEENTQVLAYKDSISEITKVIEQINTNLN